jgi:hypothetical protein
MGAADEDHELRFTPTPAITTPRSTSSYPLPMLDT